ncbi:MAG: matrixin family metalloprotease [Labilithrix sp.]|nr:matrixin family metalloprotease [Labilithrix sp.]
MAPVSNLSSIRGGAVGSIVRAALAAVTGAALFVSAPGDAEAYQIKRTSRGELVHWEERTVQYTLDASLDRAVTQATEATLSAMDSWSGTVGAPDLEVVPADATSPKKPGFDQKNGVFYMRGGYAPAGRALAITVLTYDNASGNILDADIIFNGAYSFEVLEAPGTPTLAHDPSATAAHPSNTDGISHGGDVTVETSSELVYDLHHVIAHELGHSLGMNDEMGRKDALMYRFSAPNDASIREPGADDIAGLAELYSTKLEARGNGCSSATVAPKKPTSMASNAAMFATLGLVVFLALRAKSDRRARLGFVLAAAAATVALVPSLSGKAGPGVARAAESHAVGHARAKVLRTSTAIENGLFKTSYTLATTTCRTASCPKAGHGATWGGTIGNITQEVGGYYAPTGGDEVDVSFASLPSALGPMTKPLAGRLSAANANADVSVSVLTRAAE